MPDSRTAKVPNFILAGAGESGTTSLYRYLKQHPQVYMSPIKEPNFFAAADIMSLPIFKPMEDQRLFALLDKIEAHGHSAGPLSLPVTKWEHYLRLFQNVRDEIAIGEASVMYLWFPGAAPAIQRTLPRCKLLFLLRDPVERLHTLYLKDLHRGQRGTFRDWVLPAMQAKPDRRMEMQRHPIPLDCGLYATHLQQYFDLFPREQIRIYPYEAYRADARTILRDIFKFLGVDAEQPIDTSQRHHETKVPRFPVLHQLRRRLAGDVRPTGWLPNPVAQVLSSFYFRPKGRDAMAPADRRLVVEYYQEEILRTQNLIGCDLSAWLR